MDGLADIPESGDDVTNRFVAESAKGDSASTSGSGRVKNAAWVNSVLPFMIATGPVGTLVVLLILNLHGTVIDVSLAVTLFNAVSIPAAIFWGFATDRFHRRKLIIVGSYVATAVVLLLFLFAGSLFYVSFLYALFSFVTAAVTTPLNLLVMETSPKQKWTTAFAWFSMISSIGTTVGLILSTVWSYFFLLSYLVIPLAILSLASAGLSVVMIEAPSVVFERQMVIHSKPSFLQRLRHLPLIFLRIPRLSDFKRVFRGLRFDLTRNVPVLYFSIFMFYLASGLFNTSVIPSMEVNKISSLSIFFVITIVNLIQIASFRYAGPYAEKRSLMGASIFSLALRAIGYALLGVSFYFVSGVLYVFPALVLYSLASGFAFSVYYTASNTMVFNTLGDRSNGSTLGVYSALVGIATMVGSLISGFSSFYLTFGVTFVLASACLGFSIWLVSLLREP